MELVEYWEIYLTNTWFTDFRGFRVSLRIGKGVVIEAIPLLQT